MSDRFSSATFGFGLSRNVVIASGVVLFHVGALWALQSGLLRRNAEVFIPVQILSEFIEPPLPIEPPVPVPQETKQQIRRSLPSRPQVLRPPKPVLAPDFPTDNMGSSPLPAPITLQEPPEPPSTPPLTPEVQLPSTDADYADGCRPIYPAMSKRLGEQGKVTLKVLVGSDGLPKQVEIRNSSGFERLDNAAREAMMRCRFSPGKVGGIAQSMPYDAPVNFVLR